MCYIPLWHLTKDISKGRPDKECIRPLIDDVYNESKTLLLSMGAAFFISVCL